MGRDEKGRIGSDAPPPCRNVCAFPKTVEVHEISVGSRVGMKRLDTFHVDVRRCDRLGQTRECGVNTSYAMGGWRLDK